MTKSAVVAFVVLCALVLSAVRSAAGQATRPSLDVPAAAQASPSFDAEGATRAWLDSIPEEARARSDAYFEGGYWLLLWNALLSAGILLMVLATGLSGRMRDLGRRITRWHSVHVAAYWVQLILIFSVLSFPLTAYQGFFREHGYGLATQSFGSWMRDQIIGLVLIAILGGVFVVAIHRVLRAAPRTWWIWGWAVAIAFQALGGVIGPVYIAPLFNRYTTLNDAEVAGPILSMARANGVPASEVYVSDASRQSTRVSANVSGLLGTERITLNDNLLNRTSLEEIEAVMGHELGHYVLNHVYKGLLFFSVLLFVLFALLFRGSSWAVRRWGALWRLESVDDVAALPVLGLIVVAFLFLATPVVNTHIRTQEQEADLYGLNASRRPDGHAAIELKLAEYRKLEPAAWEEIVFFDHPSGRARIFAAMRWKAEQLGEQ